MALNYNPKDAVSVWPAGDYDATLKKVEEKTSKTSGKPMEVWTFEVYSPDGQTRLIDDYVVIPAGTFKIKQLATALGLKDAFDAGAFQAEDNIGAGVVAVLAIDKQDGYDDKNKIVKVKAPANAPAPAPRQQRPAPARRPVTSPPISEHQEFKEDDIPF